MGCRSLGSHGRHHLLSAAAPTLLDTLHRSHRPDTGKGTVRPWGSSSCTCDAVSCTAASSAAGVLKCPSAARCATSSRATLPPSAALPTRTCKRHVQTLLTAWNSRCIAIVRSCQCPAVLCRCSMRWLANASPAW